MIKVSNKAKSELSNIINSRKLNPDQCIRISVPPAWKGEGDNMSKWFRPPTWDNKHILNYSINVKELGWDSFGKSHSRKRLDCINLNDETIKEVLKKFETIHE